MLAVVSGNGRGQMPTVNAHWRHGLLDSDQRRPRDHPDCPETGKQRRVVCVVTMPATFPPLLSRRPYPAQRSPTSSHILTSSPPVSSSLNNVAKPPQCWPVLPYYYLSPAQDLEPPLHHLQASFSLRTSVRQLSRRCWTLPRCHAIAATSHFISRHTTVHSCRLYRPFFSDRM